MTRARCGPIPRSRWFLPLMAASGVAMSLTAPLEVLFVREFWHNSIYIGVFMLSAALGVIVIDVFGTRFVPRLDARAALIIGLCLFGAACIGMGLASGGVLLMTSRVMQGFGGGVVLGAGLQAAVRVDPATGDIARSLGRFNAAFLFGGAVGSPGGLLVAGLIAGRAGYQIAFVVTGGLAVVVAAALAAALPSLAAPPESPPPRISLPKFDGTPGGGAALILAMSGDFLRGGVLFTALPLAGAAREYSTNTITAAIALMSGVEIAVLAVAYRIIRHIGVVAVLITSFALGMVCATLLALIPGATTYLVASALFGVSLAGATASLPVMVVAQVGESSAGLAKFRISAGIGLLAGSVGCAVLEAQIGIAALFALIAIVLLGSARLAHVVGRRLPAT
ncbi:arabinose efflux permease family protein [Mycobacterium sp. JS623]|uniref:MFS transporter n=1 Tax=Mycobacterium sp. JS623 TaxID=212767 RepID=UPI0002A5A9AC|nr:MFS transporter [Mycobacterium sp. JS623]AGB25391.1 arabinose efflux permease family protein [Mycobacterium sp. JS623]